MPVGNVLMAVGLLVLIVGLASVIYPLRAVRIQSRKTAGLVALGGLVLLIIGVGMSDSDQVAEGPTAESDAGSPAAEKQLEVVEAEVERLRAELEVAETERDEAAQSAEMLAEDNSRLVRTVASLETEIEGLEADLSVTLQQVDDLLLRYDPEIKAELEAAYTSEADRACQQAKENIDASIAALIAWDASWESIHTRDDLIADVTECSAAERAKTAEQREADRLAACISIEPGQLEKNPDAYRGECVVLYANVVQWDANTGPCSFHAEVSATRSTRWYDYDTRSTFGIEDSEIDSALATDCPELSDYDNGDYLKVWATGLGSFSYSTSMGGTNTIPSFKIEKVELVKKDD